jgi:hypothetical protein
VAKKVASSRQPSLAALLTLSPYYWPEELVNERDKRYGIRLDPDGAGQGGGACSAHDGVSLNEFAARDAVVQQRASLSTWHGTRPRPLPVCGAPPHAPRLACSAAARGRADVGLFRRGVGAAGGVDAAAELQQRLQQAVTKEQRAAAMAGGVGAGGAANGVAGLGRPGEAPPAAAVAADADGDAEGVGDVVHDEDDDEVMEHDDYYQVCVCVREVGVAVVTLSCAAWWTWCVLHALAARSPAE